LRNVSPSERRYSANGTAANNGASALSSGNNTRIRPEGACAGSKRTATNASLGSNSERCRVRYACIDSVTVANTSNRISSSIGLDLGLRAVVVQDALGDPLQFFRELRFEPRIDRQEHRRDQAGDHQVFG